MLKWLELRDWEKAFMNVIPGRKFKEVKSAVSPSQPISSPKQKEEEIDSSKVINAFCGL